MDHAEAAEINFAEGSNQENFDRVGAILAPRFEFHIGSRAQSMTVDHLDAIVRCRQIGFPDLSFAVHSVAGSASRAAVHATHQGTHRGSGAISSPRVDRSTSSTCSSSDSRATW